MTALITIAEHRARRRARRHRLAWLAVEFVTIAAAGALAGYLLAASDRAEPTRSSVHFTIPEERSFNV